MLRTFCWSLSLLLLSFHIEAAVSQEPDAPTSGSIRTDFSPGMLPPTPQMWFYEQEMRRLHEPSEMIYARARERASQRTRRIAAMDWYGYSNSRPTASNNNMIGPYSPRWVGNTYNAFSFRPSTSGYLVLRAGAPLY